MQPLNIACNSMAAKYKPDKNVIHASQCTGDGIIFINNHMTEKSSILLVCSICRELMIESLIISNRR